MLTNEQRAALKLLRERAKDGRSFSQGDIELAAGWTKATFDTYKTKHLKHYLTRVGPGAYKVDPSLGRLTESDFEEIVSQSRKTLARFVRTVFGAVLRYEFLLPLTNELKLRAALDALFYRDTLHQRAIELGTEALAQIVPRDAGEVDSAFVERVAAKVGDLLGGYSIGHVHGRFRADELQTYAQAAEILAERGRYLVDETTALVRFILPLQSTRRQSADAFQLDRISPDASDSLRREVVAARSLFIAFVVESAIIDIHGEDEIWFLEAGPEGERLYVLARETPTPSPNKAEDVQLELHTISPVETWLRENEYDTIADDIASIQESWRTNKVKTRRNWWAILAGDKKGRPRSVAGVTFPIIASVRAPEGFPSVKDGLSRPAEKPPPPKVV